MLGYDRPLKPECIYKSLRMIKEGKKPTDYYDTYNDIAVELTGKDGRRKTRTVLFRTFIFSFQEKQSIIENNILIHLSKNHELDYMKPLYMAKFMITKYWLTLQKCFSRYLILHKPSAQRLLQQRWLKSMEIQKL